MLSLKSRTIDPDITVLKRDLCALLGRVKVGPGTMTTATTQKGESIFASVKTHLFVIVEGIRIRVK